MSTTLLDLLSLVNADVLAAVRQTRQVAGATAPALAQQLADADAIQRAYRALPAAEKAFMDRLLLRGRDWAAGLQIEMVGLELAEPDTPPTLSSQFRYLPSLTRSASRRFGDIYARLLAAGLVFTIEPSYFSPQPLDFSPGRVLCVPAEVQRALPRPDLDLKLIEDSAISDRRLARAEFSCLRFFALWEQVSRQPIRRTVQGSLHRVDVRKAGRALVMGGQALNEQEIVELTEFYVTTAAHLGILDDGPDLLSSHPAPAVFKLSQPALLQRALAVLPQAPPQPGLEGSMAAGGGQGWAAQKVQENLLRFLQTVPQNAWISFDSFSQSVRRLAPELLRTRAEQAMGAGWNIHEQPFIADFIRGALHWLAACDISLDSSGDLLAFRMLREGLAALLADQAPPRPAPGLMVVQPTFQVIALPPLALDMLCQLSDFANLTRLAEAPEFKLTKESLYRAAQAGYSLDQVIEALQRWSRSALPGNVQREMEEWAGRHARITLRRSAPLLQTASEALLDELLADRALAPFFGERLAPTVVELTTDDAHRAVQLWQTLVNRGELAMQMDPEAPTGGWRLTAEGELRSVAALPDPLWLPVLQKVAAPAADADAPPGTVWTITPEKVRALADKNSSAAPYLAQLQKLVRGPLPADLIQRIERWARPPETAQIGRVILLRVSMAETATNLLADRSLRGALRPLPGADGSWLVVKEEALPRVRARLAAWEVTVTEGIGG